MTIDEGFAHVWHARLLGSGERRVGTGARVPIYVIHYIYVNVTHCIASTGDN